MDLPGSECLILKGDGETKLHTRGEVDQVARLTLRERAHRAAGITAARHSGVTWGRIAAEFEVSVRQAQNIYDGWCAAEPQSGDGAPDAVQELVALLRQTMEDLAVIARQEQHAGYRVAALRSLVETAIRKWNFERSMGLIQPGHVLRGFDELEVLTREFSQIISRQDVPEEAVQALADLVDRLKAHPLSADHRASPAEIASAVRAAA